jgi:hypothetical protein
LPRHPKAQAIQQNVFRQQRRHRQNGGTGRNWRRHSVLAIATPDFGTLIARWQFRGLKHTASLEWRGRDYIYRQWDCIEHN